MICYIVWLFKRFLVQFFFNEQYYSLVSEVLTCGKYIKKKWRILYTSWILNISWYYCGQSTVVVIMALNSAFIFFFLFLFFSLHRPLSEKSEVLWVDLANWNRQQLHQLLTSSSGESFSLFQSIWRCCFKLQSRPHWLETLAIYFKAPFVELLSFNSPD